MNTRLTSVLGRIGRLAPGVVFHAARAFARDPVGIGTAQPGVLDGFVRIDRDVALRRLLHHVQVVTRHPLPVVPFAQRVAARGVATFHLAVVADIAGLDRVHAEARIQVHRPAI